MMDVRRPAVLLLTAAFLLSACDAVEQPPSAGEPPADELVVEAPAEVDGRRDRIVPRGPRPSWDEPKTTETHPAEGGLTAPNVATPPAVGTPAENPPGTTTLPAPPKTSDATTPLPPVEGQPSTAPNGQLPSMGPQQLPPTLPKPHVSAPASFADLVERVQPAVVNIYTEQVVARQQVRIDPIYGPYAVTRPHRATSLGSGFIVDNEGYILTNTHVIKGAQSIKVSTADGREMPASVVGTDPMTDIALIRVEPFEGMTHLVLGDADQVRVGDWLMAVGNPFGLQSTVTVGILSARGRRNVPIGGDIRYVDFLQTDASINPGNSGGPLIAMDGTVIGINTAINSEGQGIGFAVPINMARSVLKDLRDTGRVSRSWIGVQLRPMPNNGEGRRPLGALVGDVVQQGPAAQAGIRRGDIILRFGEHTIQSHEDLPWLASNAGVGERVEVLIRRDGQDYIVSVTMGALPN